MNKKRIIPILMAGMVALSGALVAGCHGCRPHCPGATIDKRADWISKRVASKLDLTDAQKVTLDKIKAEVVEKMKAHRADRDKGFDDVLALVGKDKITKDDVAKLADRREAKMKELKPFVIDKIVEFHNMLTPAQRQKVADVIKKHHDRCSPK